MKLRVVFAGTSKFAARQLELLARHPSVELIGVITQPDRPAGRTYKLQPSPVKTVAQSLALKIYLPEQASALNLGLACFSTRCDCLVVVAYGQLIPEELLNYPRFGAINVHPSLLPRWRGAAPIQRTIEAGDSVSGVTLMQLDQGLDTGPVLMQREYLLQPTETSGSLEAALGEIAWSALYDLMDKYHQGLRIEPIPQKGVACYARKVTNDEARLDCRRSSIELVRKIRAFNPIPGAYLPYHGSRLKIWDALAIERGEVEDSPPLLPGQIAKVSKNSLILATGAGFLSLLHVQKPGKKPCNIKDFLSGTPMLRVGEVLE